ncbi:MAG: hypothetical protein ACTS6J_01950 [Burkholderiales bacterium]
MASTTARELEPGPAAFYGVRPGWMHLWEQAKREGRDWYYLDNSYFDCARERQFRVTKNALQHTGRGESDGRRFASLGIKIKPMRTGGEDVIVCPSTPEFMQVVAGDPGWLDRVTRNLRRQYGADRVIVRTKQDKRPLMDDLKNARLLVTWGSAAAVTALLEGVRVACAPECCATYADDRLRWASVLADHQWDLSEFANGTAWRALNV